MNFVVEGKKELLPCSFVFHFNFDLQLLCEEWASYGVFYKYQPIDLVR